MIARVTFLLYRFHFLALIGNFVRTLFLLRERNDNCFLFFIEGLEIFRTTIRTSSQILIKELFLLYLLLYNWDQI